MKRCICGLADGGAGTALTSAIIGLGMGAMNPGYDALMDTLGRDLLFDVSLGLIAATSNMLTENSIERLLKRNISRVGAVNAMTLSVEERRW